MSELPKYEYKCIDNSVLTPHFRKFIAAPVLEWIPKSINPNLITVISSVFSLIALYLSFRFGQGLVNNLIIAFLIFMYLLSDHLDGMQAKRRGGGTALGEFLDHFLDVINNGIFLLILVNIFKVSNPAVITLMFALGYVAQGGVFFEQYKTGWIVFGKYESFEAVVALILTLIITGIPLIYQPLISIEYYELRLIDWLLIITSISGSFILKDIIVRVGSGMKEMAGLVLSMMTMLSIAFLFGLHRDAFIIASIAAIFIIQEYMIARLTYKRSIWLEYIPVLILIGGVFFQLITGYYLIISLLIIIRFIVTIFKLSKKIQLYS